VSPGISGAFKWALAWLNSLTLRANDDIELGETARTVTVTTTIGDNSLSRNVVVTRANDPGGYPVRWPRW
jgi:hypothetical protein